MTDSVIEKPTSIIKVASDKLFPQLIVGLRRVNLSLIHPKKVNYQLTRSHIGPITALRF